MPGDDAVSEFQSVLDFWFEETAPVQWFREDTAFDRLITERFAGLHERAAAGRLAAWEETAPGALALVITLDQFARNMFRGTPDAFAGDPAARAVADRALARGHDQALPADRRVFFYMPFMHSEALADQERCVALCAALTAAAPGDNHAYAVSHRDIIARFGRFPHRNAILGRTSTDEERAFLTQPGSSF